MNNVEQVIVLGAGASKSDYAPLQADLFRAFFEDYMQNINAERNPLYRKQEELLGQFFEKFWNINIQNPEDSQFPTFEECLGVLDLAYIRRDGFKDFPKIEINETRNALIFLIGKVLDEKLMNNPNINHQRLINRLSESNSLKKTAFISFNYDIIIDNVLTSMQGQNDFFVDYGINFLNEDWKNTDSQNPVYLFKIHGSLNWLYCSTCNEMEYTPGQKRKVYNSICQNESCSKCRMPLEPVIVPPTYYKDMNNIFLQEIFLKTENILRNADRIFFCGYSFPDSDIHFKYIIKRAELLNSEHLDTYIINRNPNSRDDATCTENCTERCGERCATDRKKDNENRISRIFKNKQNVNFTDLSFEEFCSNGV